MADFYGLIDTYATLHNMDRSDVLDLWYRGAVDATSLLEADLENEGIFGYCEHLISVIRLLHDRSMKDHKVNPWTCEEVPE